MAHISKPSNLNLAGYLLIVLWGMSTWIHINAIFAQLPMIVPCVAEKGSIASVISLAIQIGNIGPILLTIIQQRHFFGWVSTEPGSRPPRVISYFIFIIILIGICGSFLLTARWNAKDGSRSYTLIVTTFFLALAATSSSLVFFDYIKRYTAAFSVNALLLGEAMNTIIPALLVLIQTKAHVAPCPVGNTSTIPLSTQCDQGQQDLLFSTSVYFAIIGCLILLSFVAFTFLDIGLLNPRKEVPTTGRLGELPLNEVTDSSKGNSTEDIVDSLSDKKIRRDIFRLLTISVAVNFLNFGILPALITYSTLPYGRLTFLVASILTPFANAASVALGFVHSNAKSIRNLVFLLAVSMAGTCYILAVAFMSPCSPRYRTPEGGVTIVSVWFLATLSLCYTRLLIVNRIRTIDPSKMFWFGFSVQMGGLLGAVPMYIITSHTALLKFVDTCQPVSC